MGFKLMVALGAAALLTSGAAWADPPTGSRLGTHTQPGPKLTARDQAIGAKRFATCLFNRKGSLARDTLLASTKQIADTGIDKLGGSIDCYGQMFSNEMVEERHIEFPSEILRGMLAEEALTRARAAVSALQPLPLQKIYQRDWFAVTGRHITVDEMGACIADTNPAGIAALIVTEPASKEENGAFAGLNDNLGKCLRAGTKLQAKRQGLRAALADALFQRLNRPQPVAATK